MTLSDLEWPFHALRAISAVAECLVYTTTSFRDKFVVVTSASEVIAVFSLWWHEQMKCMKLF